MSGLVKPGWRKLTAWLLCFLLGAAVSAIHMTKGGQDIPPNVVAFLNWNTAFFFGANVAKSGFQMLSNVFAKNGTGKSVEVTG